MNHPMDDDSCMGCSMTQLMGPLYVPWNMSWYWAQPWRRLCCTLGASMVAPMVHVLGIFHGHPWHVPRNGRYAWVVHGVVHLSMDDAILSFLDGSVDTRHGRPHHMIVPRCVLFRMPWRNDESYVPYHGRHHRTTCGAAGAATCSMFSDDCTPEGLVWFVRSWLLQIRPTVS